MGNRIKPAHVRMAQAYRNAGPRHLVGLMRSHSGDWKRGEGIHNTPYGPLAKHPRRKITALVRDRLRPRPNETRWGQEPEPRVDLDSMNRDALRALAKERGLKGYGKMTAPALRDVLR